MIQLSPTSYSMTPLPAHIKVGNFVSIGSDVKFIDGGTHLAEINHKCVFTTHFEQTNEREPIEIGHDTWIGDGVRIKNGIKIGIGAIIGQGAVITRDVPDFAVVVGNPQQIKRIRFTADQIAKLMQISWWHWSKDEVMADIETFKDIDSFIEKYGSKKANN